MKPSQFQFITNFSLQPVNIIPTDDNDEVFFNNLIEFGNFPDKTCPVVLYLYPIDFISLVLIVTNPSLFVQNEILINSTLYIALRGKWTIIKSYRLISIIRKRVKSKSSVKSKNSFVHALFLR